MTCAARPSRRALAPLALLLGACAAADRTDTRRGPEAVIPWFEAGDPRVDTAGFVGATLRLHHERDGVRYTLMAFGVGETLTLGAMVAGSFDGTVTWRVGARRLSFAFDTAGSLRDLAVRVDGAAATLTGDGATFRGTTWVNVDLPRRAWIADDTPLQLTFTPAAGAPLSLPDDGHPYRVRIAAG